MFIIQRLTEKNTRLDTAVLIKVNQGDCFFSEIQKGEELKQIVEVKG